METMKAKRMARELMDENGLNHVSFRLNRATQSLGLCKSERNTYTGMYRVRSIELSQKWIPHLSEAEVRDVILHEIAHAIAGHDAGHGPRWKAVARTIGANPTRTAEQVPREVQERVMQLNAKYRAECRSCDNVVYFSRMTKAWRAGRKLCGRCRSDLRVLANRA